MNMFYRRSINEYRRQITLKDSFAIQTERLRDVLGSIKWTNFEEPPTNRRALHRRFSLLLLSPLIEIAWADGRVTRRESDAILQVAESFGLMKRDATRCELLELLTSRPLPYDVGQMWRDLSNFFEKLPEFDRQTVAYSLTVQAQFVAEQSSDNLMAFLRGERVSTSEREALRIIAEQLKTAEAAAALRDKQRNVNLFFEKEATEARESTAPVSADHPGNYEPQTALDDYGALIPLIPLIKVAWAEGRITKRERELIFQTAERKGIEAGSPLHERLASWLELHPTDDFYLESLERISDGWHDLPEEEKILRRLDLLSDCVNVAEASGGTAHYAAGGPRICDEEFAAVKRIAHKLNAPPTKSPDALISLAA